MNGKKGKLTQSEFKVIFKTNNELTEIDINDKLHIPSIDVLTIAKACNMMAENPSLHARWNVLSNKAAVEADYEKINFEVWVKERSKHYRELLATESGRRVTDKMVEEAVMTDEDYLRKYRILLDKREDASNLRSIAFGFGERGERLVNIVSMMKSEKSTGRIKSDFSSDESDDVSAFTDKEEKNDE